jgi:transposase
MKYYAGIDVSLNSSNVCVVDASGKIVREDKVTSEPAAMIKWFMSLGMRLERIGLEAGPLSQWLYGALHESECTGWNPAQPHQLRQAARVVAVRLHLLRR